MLSMIIPVYNEEKTIGETIDKTLSELKKMDFPFELIVVNDASEDDTLHILHDFRGSIKIISHPINSGYGRALKSGIEQAEYENIMIMDGDGTYPETMIAKLYEEFSKGFDLLIGEREIKTDSLTQKFTRFVYRLLLFFIVGEKVPDANSGLRVFKKELMEDKIAFFCNGFSFTTSQTLIFLAESRFVGFYPIGYGIRKTSTKTKLFRDALRTLQYMVEIIIRYNPLKLFLLVSIVPVILLIVLLSAAFLTGINWYYLFSVLVFCFLGVFYGLALLTYSVSSRR